MLYIISPYHHCPSKLVWLLQSRDFQSFVCVPWTICTVAAAQVDCFYINQKDSHEDRGPENDYMQDAHPARFMNKQGTNSRQSNCT